MSSPLKKVFSKRSTSLSGSRSRPSYLPPHNLTVLNSHSEYQNDSFCTSENRNLNTEPSFRTNDGQHWTYENNVSLCREIERLCDSNYQLNEDNKALAEKLTQNRNLEERLYQLEVENAQLIKEIAKKSELLSWKEKELNQTNQDVLRKIQYQPAYGEIFAQNKALIDEVSTLRAQLVTGKQEKNSYETSQGSPHKAQLRLEQALNQIELLKEDLVRKNYKIEEMTDIVNKLKAEKHQFQDDEERLKQRDLVEKEYKLEIINLKEELESVRNKLGQALFRAETAETKEGHLKNSILEIETETQSLKQTLLRIQQDTEEELRARENYLEASIKAKTNEAIKQMLKEKVQYEEMITYLKDKVESLEKENASLKINLEVERRELHEEKRTSKDSERNFKSLRGSAREDSNFYDFSVLKEALRNEEIRNKKCEEELEYTKIKVVELEKELEEAREKLKEEILRREKSNYDTENSLRKENMILKEEIALLEAKITEYKNQIENDNLKVQSVTNDCEKLAALYTEIEEQLETERCEKEQLAEEYLNKMEQLEAELNELKTKDLDVVETTSRFSREKKNYEREIQQFRAVNERTKEELEKIYELLAQGKQETEVYKQQNEQLKREIERLKNPFLSGGKSNDQDVETMTKNFDNSERKAVIRLNKMLEETSLKRSLKTEDFDPSYDENK